MSKLDKNQRVRTSKQRQVFDLSHDYLFTATTGQLRPVSHDLLQPGDTVSCKFDFFLRSMPLSTAAMIDVDFMVDYFFVPLDLIWLGFDAWWSRTRSVFFVNYDEVNQSNRSPLPAIDALPMLDLKKVFESINATDDKWQSVRLLDDLGFSGMAFHDASGFVHPIHNAGVITDGVYPSVFPWQMCAYECIYMHYYRDDEREAFNPAAYNFPIQVNNPGARNGFPKMRYVNRMDDYFTATKLSPLVSNINNDPDFLHDFDIKLGQNIFNYDLYSDTYISGYQTPINLENVGETSGDSTSETRAVNQLRALLAQEKLLHVMNMTHKDYDSQVLARLGYDVPKDVRHQIHHLGHDTCQLNIQEIVSGSNTFNGEIGSSLGDLAGQGKAISRNFDGVKKFTAPCHGVLMTIWTCRTRPKYTTSALRKDMLQQIYDFFTPELDDLGMAPQYRYESDLINHRMLSGIGGLAEDNRFTITGWNYRYEYLKRNINRSSLAFMRASDGLQERYSPETPLGFNSYSQWSHSRIPLDMGLRTESGSVVLVPEDDYYTRPHFDLYKVQPDELNNVMLVSWLKTPPLDDQGVPTEDWSKFPWLIYQRDPFIVDGRFSCKKVSAMSLYSMPKLI